ncbi:transposase [Enterocloster bolteae]|uniref:transposase n=1 Tax=Enterocloster bolteae TaxID=208479 RepID=UPI0028FE0505|nr:transposase [Enterocloster bolteae]MDU1138072.1 transposase [Enterocloster bolteae]
MILREIDNINCFSPTSKPLAFARLDPLVYQSGNFQAEKNRMYKHSSHVFRYALVNAAHNVVNKANFNAYYSQQSGKPVPQ